MFAQDRGSGSAHWRKWKCSLLCDCYPLCTDHVPLPLPSPVLPERLERFKHGGCPRPAWPPGLPQLLLLLAGQQRSRGARVNISPGQQGVQITAEPCQEVSALGPRFGDSSSARSSTSGGCQVFKSGGLGQTGTSHFGVWWKQPGALAWNFPALLHGFCLLSRHTQHGSGAEQSSPRCRAVLS